MLGLVLGAERCMRSVKEGEEELISGLPEYL